MPQPVWVLALGLREGLPYVETWFCGPGDWGCIQRSDALFLTLETSTMGFEALTCLIFMVKIHLLCSNHAAFSVGVYINLLNSCVHSKEVSRNRKYMYTYTYMKYILKWNYLYQEYCLSYWIFLRILFFKLRNIGVKKILYCVWLFSNLYFHIIYIF